MVAAMLLLAIVDRISAAVFGSIIALLYAAGRAGGGAAVGQDPVQRTTGDTAD
jgi:hypothetical protein